MNKQLPILLALISAALFGSATPASKLLLDSFSPIQLAGLLYLGAAIGVMPLLLKNKEIKLPKHLSNKNRIYLLGSIILGGILAPIFLLLGLQVASAASVSLWLNLELVALYITSAQNLGATRSQMIFSSSPLFGILFSALILGEELSLFQQVALLLKISSLFALFQDQHSHQHEHMGIAHQHLHNHNDGHHTHDHPGFSTSLTHSHWHEHEAILHTHFHLPDIHHRHKHD
jgi:drug/metabolite transporter (DMT)-like permease